MGIEALLRLIEEEHVRGPDEHEGEMEQLLLPRRQLVRESRCEMGDFQRLELGEDDEARAAQTNRSVLWTVGLAFFLADNTARVVDMPVVTVRPSVEDIQIVAVGAATLAQQLAAR